MVSSGRSGGVSPELAQLRRQLAPSRASKGSAGARAKRGRRVLQRLRRLARTGRGCNARSPARKFRQGYVRSPGTARRSRLRACGQAAKATSASESAGAMLGSNSMLFCVRLSDGYFFPAPKSQFAQAGRCQGHGRQCRYICDDAGVDLYMLGGSQSRTEEMVALETPNPTRTFRRAFKYRDDANFRACDLKRFYQRVADSGHARSRPPI